MCGGAGWLRYDGRHARVCPGCCEHGSGVWQLNPDCHHVVDGRIWCCSAGCGTTWESQAAYQADVQRFVATDAQWAELQRALEAPVEPSPKLERLWERNTPFQD
ncbi:MAG: hypothetical protein O3A42_18385 [Actinobacteria bacterium]|nr:hypothetical protein [Actinomycetota bacterium]